MKNNLSFPQTPSVLDYPSAAQAIADYLLQINHGAYRPDRRRVLSVRKTDRTASLRDAALPARGEVFYFIEGELFSEMDATRLREGESPQARAEKLLHGVWEQLQVWSAYDFARSTSGMNAP
ncbi:MAG: hypothetical protein LBD68_00860 [Zoogloeaceae bacterium]|jgi:hypothetical protein|nr:hypothetical protein [Zoogloeaceae bacterium]